MDKRVLRLYALSKYNEFKNMINKLHQIANEDGVISITSDMIPPSLERIVHSNLRFSHEGVEDENYKKLKKVHQVAETNIISKKYNAGL